MTFKLDIFEPNWRANQGKALEHLVEKSQRPNMFVVKIPDAHSYGGSRFYERVACDFIGHICGFPLMLECKESKEKRIFLSTILQKKSRHQFETMSRWADSHRNNIGGYLCHTEGRYLTWVPVQSLQSVKSVGRECWNPDLRIRGIDLLNQPLDWVKLILDGDSKS